jgi:2-succinyl-5-enolpyruvyl-6-hydroxy-3-cyclohexene-1-carboxylate synthase
MLIASRLELDLTIVLLDNGGGAIFEFLPVSQMPMALGGGRYGHHIATPTGLDFARLAGAYGFAHEHAGDRAGFRAALARALAGGGSSVIEVRGERRANLELHERLWHSVRAALSPREAEAAPPA